MTLLNKSENMCDVVSDVAKLTSPILTGQNNIITEISNSTEDRMLDGVLTGQGHGTKQARMSLSEIFATARGSKAELSRGLGSNTTMTVYAGTGVTRQRRW